METQRNPLSLQLHKTKAFSEINRVQKNGFHLIKEKNLQGQDNFLGEKIKKLDTFVSFFFLQGVICSIKTRYEVTCNKTLSYIKLENFCKVANLSDSFFATKCQ